MLLLSNIIVNTTILVKNLDTLHIFSVEYDFPHCTITTIFSPLSPYNVVLGAIALQIDTHLFLIYQ
jgi:hypothetical protein